MAAVLAIEGAMVAEIGVLLAPDSLQDAHALNADVISVIFPAAASQCVAAVWDSCRGGAHFPGPDAQICDRGSCPPPFSRLRSPRYIGKQLTHETILAKAIPLVGIGASTPGWNWLEVQAIGARRGHPIFQRRAHWPGVAGQDMHFPSPKAVWTKVRRYLPGKPKGTGVSGPLQMHPFTLRTVTTDNGPLTTDN